MTEHVDVAIIGGGITGLAAAWYVQQATEPVRYALLEAGNRWGGKIQTEHVSWNDAGEFVVEGGPDSFISQKPWAQQLARELGLADEFLPTNDDRRKTYVLHKGKPTPLPDGVMLIVPTKIMPFVTSPLISPLGKLRMGLDFIIPPKTDGEDETLADFIRRRLGDEALDKIAEPLMSGIYNSEAERQSLLATFPRFRDIEEKHGSLIRGMLASRRARQAAPKPAQASGNGKQPTSMFVSFRGGMERLVEGLVARLTGDLRLNSRVEELTTLPDGGYRLRLADGTEFEAASVILTVPSYVAAELVDHLSPDAAELLADIRYVSTGTISLGYRRDEFGHPLDGFGVVIPSSEQRQINAITWTSTKFDHRSPEEHVLVRVFFGGSRTPQMMEVDDQNLAAIVRLELQEIMGVTAEPVLQRIYRWSPATPQYDLGHLERVEQIENSLPPGILVAGSPYRGIGLPDCVHQGQQAAEKAIAQHKTTAVNASSTATDRR